MDVLLHQHLRREVRGLRAEDGERPAGLRLARRDEQRVRHARRERQSLRASSPRAPRPSPTISASLTDPRSGSATPRGRAAAARTGSACRAPSGRASGSSTERKLAPDALARCGGRSACARPAARAPTRAPRRRRRRRSRRPPRRWRRRPAGFQSSGPCGRPIAAYSPGIFSGFEPRLGDVGVDAGDVLRAGRRAARSASCLEAAAGAARSARSAPPRCTARRSTSARRTRGWRARRRRTTTAAPRPRWRKTSMKNRRSSAVA